MLTAKDSPQDDVIEKDQLVQDLKVLGVQPGDCLNIKISLKSIGHVRGGANTVIEALLEAVGPEGTIVSDSFISVYPLPLSQEDAQKISDRWTPSYAGAIANAMIKHPKAIRSQHPIQKYVAIGARAEELMNNHTPANQAYEVLRIMTKTGGRNLKIGTDEKVIGVGTTHAAVEVLGLKQKRKKAGVNYRNEKGEIVTFERDWAGGCAWGFNNFIPLYRESGAIVAEGKIGKADSKITDMAATMALELEVIKKNPAFMLCSNPACEDCRLGWEFSNGSRFIVKVHQLKNSILRRFRQLVQKINQMLKPGAGARATR